MRPMLATPAETVPPGAAWVHEVKWDGMRVIVEAKGGALTATSRTGRDVTVAFPELAPLAGLYDDMVLDGELVALVDGIPSFAGLTERMHVTGARRAARLVTTRPVTLMAFDLLRLLGQDLTGQPWAARRRLLEQLEIDGSRWQVPPTYEDGEGLLAATAGQGLEGIVSKRRDSPYAAGRRSPDWRKLAHRDSESVVVGGWRPETGGTSRLGAVLVGVPGVQGWEFVGRVGSGLAGRAGAALLCRLRPHERGDSPFVTAVPREDAAGATWVEPEVVIDVASLGRGGGRLRQPSFLRVRSDLTATDLRETTDG